MPLSIWLASLAVVSAIPILWWALSDRTDVSSQVAKNLGERRPQTLRAATLDRPAAERLVLPVLRGTGRTARRFTPAAWLENIEQRLGRAGLLGRFTSDQIVGAKVLLSVIVVLYGGLRFVLDPTPNLGFWTVAFAIFAFFVPDLILSSIGKRRAEDMERALPDVLDQLTVSVEAGLGFEAAISRIADNRDDALSGELSRMIQDVRLGRPRSLALAELADRTDVDDLQHLTLALRQAEKLGVPMAQTLRAQAAEIREKRRFRAEEAAYKLPVKMIFPLGLCILPAMFIVVLGPAAIELGNLF